MLLWNEPRDKNTLVLDGLDHLAHGISVVDRDLSFVFANRAYFDLMGVPRGFLATRRGIADVSRLKAKRGDYGDGDVETLVAEQVNRARRLDPRCFETPGIGGSILLVERYPLPGGGFVQELTDVTERRRAERALRRSEESLANAQRIARLGNWDWNMGDNSLFWSDEIYRVFGVEPREFAATYDAFLGFVHPDDRDHVEESVRRALEDDLAYDIDHRIVRPDGEVRVVHERAEVIRDASGRPLRMRGTVQDVTAIRATESELRKFGRVVEHAPNLIVITDREGRIEYVNPKFVEVTGYAVEEVIGRTPAILRSGSTPPEVYRGLWERILAGHEWQGEILNRKKNGELYWCRESISPIRSDSGEITHFLAIEEDISAQRAIEDQLVQVQKMETVGQLTGGIAHDFNNLLSIIMGNLELLQERIADDEDLATLIRPAVMAAERGAALTHRLLAFSRKQTQRPQPTDPNRLVEDLLDMLRRTLGETVEIATRLTEKPWPLMVDRSHFENALINLAVNARHAMPEGGSLTMETANVSLDEHAASTLGDLAPGEYVRLAVTDTGCGMAPEIKARAFEPFFTTKEAGSGSGLGLSMVYGFVRQSGGIVAIDSEEGRGTTVALYLPREERAGFDGRPPEGVDAPAGRGEVILVAEDEADVRAILANQLRVLGYAVHVAENGPVALEMARRMPRLDLLLTDAVMPGDMCGVELGEAARAGIPGLKVLIMSGYSEYGCGCGGLPAGFATLAKPFSRSDLACALRAALDSPAS